MKSLVLLSALTALLVTLCQVQANAKDYIVKDTDADAQQLIELLDGHTLVCTPSDKKDYKLEEKNFYPIKISAVSAEKTIKISIATGDPKVRFGFGGDDLTDVEVSASWLHLSVGDDGRREFMVQLRGKLTKDDACYKDKNGKVDFESGNIPGLNSTIWDAGTIAAHGIACCWE